MHRGTQIPTGDDSGDERDWKGGDRCGKDITRGGKGQMNGKGGEEMAGETFSLSLQVALESSFGENRNTKQNSLTHTSQPKTCTHEHRRTGTRHNYYE